jgi:hyperosmotically inducible protein
MGQLKYTILVSALAAASLAAAGCEQKSTGDKVGQTSPPQQAMQTAPQSAPTQSASNDQSSSSTSPSSTMSSPGSSSSASQSTTAAVDDTMITAKVKAALLAEPGLKSTEIDVATKDATVTLSGAVDSQAMKDRAKQVAMSTQGVKDVVDNMNLKSTS